MTRAVYTAEQFIKAIPGSGGIISTIARRVGCGWLAEEADRQKGKIDG